MKALAAPTLAPSIVRCTLPSDGYKRAAATLPCSSCSYRYCYHHLPVLVAMCFPLTSSRSYRSTNNASQIRQGLSLILRPVFRPGSRALLATTNRNNGMNYVTDRGHLAYISHLSERQVGGSHLAKTNQQILSEVTLPRILGGLLLVSVAGSLCHMMPGLGGGSRMKNPNYRILPSWTPESNSSRGFLVHMTDITHEAMLTNSALHYQCSAAFMHSGSQTREPTHTMSLGNVVEGGWRGRRLSDPVTCLVGVALYCLWSGCSHPATCLACLTRRLTLA